jgi:hypothetical protein
MAPQERIDELRPEVAAAFEGRASLTTAISGMLEVGGGGGVGAGRGGVEGAAGAHDEPAALRPRAWSGAAGASPAQPPLAPPAPPQVLPLGASKGAGVEWLLKEMGHDPAHLMAMGDGGARGCGGRRRRRRLSHPARQCSVRTPLHPALPTRSCPHPPPRERY